MLAPHRNAICYFPILIIARQRSPIHQYSWFYWMICFNLQQESNIMGAGLLTLFLLLGGCLATCVPLLGTRKGYPGWFLLSLTPAGSSRRPAGTRGIGFRKPFTAERLRPASTQLVASPRRVARDLDSNIVLHTFLPALLILRDRYCQFEYQLGGSTCLSSPILPF